MRRKRLKSSVAILLGLGLTGLHAQTMHVKEFNATQTAYNLSIMHKMTFSSGNVTVQKTDKSAGVYALSGVRYLTFQDYSVGIEEQKLIGNTNLITYPNPIADLLNIDLTGSENMTGSIRVLSIEGKMLLEQKTNGASILTLNLSQLPQGIYLCLYTNEKESKTVKIIKQ